MNNNVQTSDKILSVLTYITGGTIGFLWMIICAIKKNPVSKYLLFNIYQAIFLGLFIYLSSIILTMIYNILIMVPFINILVNFIYINLFSPIAYSWSLIEILILFLYIYLVIYSVFGKMAKIPWISNIILYQLNRF